MSVLNRRIDAVSLALAGGISWGLGAAGLAMWGMIGYGHKMLEFLADLYPGYEASISGAVFGAFWGFTDVFCGLFVFALLYNAFVGEPESS